jgi:hypothetical protein
VIWGKVTAQQQEERMPFIDIAEWMVMVKGLLRGIEACLKVKFGAEGLELMPELRQIRDPAVLEKILEKIDVAASPDDLRRIWTRKRRSKKTEPM